MIDSAINSFETFFTCPIRAALLGSSVVVFIALVKAVI
jgi:hypothetical protein